MEDVRNIAFQGRRLVCLFSLCEANKWYQPSQTGKEGHEVAVRVDFRERSEYPPSQTGKAPEGRIGLIFLDKVRSHGFLFSPLKNFSPFPQSSRTL